MIGAFFACAPAFAQEPPPAPPPESDALVQARACFERGRDAFQAARFDDAIREFKAAQALQPSPLLDYNIGLAHEQLGHPRTAIKFLRRYLQGAPDAPNRADVEIRIHALELRAQHDPRPAEPNDEPSVPRKDPYTTESIDDPLFSRKDPFTTPSLAAPAPDPPPAPRPRKRRARANAAAPATH